jgi:hypothetical protein
MEPQIFIVKPEQVGNQDISEFLRQAISKEFDGQEYFIANEQTVDKITSYSKAPRKIRMFLVQANGKSHSLFFDITEVSLINSKHWAGL